MALVRPVGAYASGDQDGHGDGRRADDDPSAVLPRFLRPRTGTRPHGKPHRLRRGLVQRRDAVVHVVFLHIGHSNHILGFVARPLPCVRASVCMYMFMGLRSGRLADGARSL